MAGPEALFFFTRGAVGMHPICHGPKESASVCAELRLEPAAAS